MKPVPLPEQLRIACAQCNLLELCLPVGLPPEELKKLDALVSLRRRIARHQSLFQANAPFEALYAVRAGFFKTTLTLSDGREQVTGFQMSGELLGLDGISSGRHAVTAIALEDSEVCVLDYSRLETLIHEIPPLMTQFHKILSREIVREQGVMTLLGSMRAEERLAAFLLNLSQRFAARGFSPTQFRLRMTREEIGSFLGLKLETISRTLSAFQEAGLIDVDRREITLLNRDALRRLLHPTPPPETAAPAPLPALQPSP
ncbi:MAG: helix-turn-helix domain-containing protein [Hydrogenophilus sp.]|nr:helix-turn-helix domain-containing protein [Hydrogenophilus sp.]